MTCKYASETIPTIDVSKQKNKVWWFTELDLRRCKWSLEFKLKATFIKHTLIMIKLEY